VTASADPHALRRAAFLDRDGVLNRRAPAHDYVKSPAEFEWLAGAREGVLRLNREGWLVLVVTNQRGVARGLMTARDVESIHAHAQRELGEIGAHVDAFYYCPHGDEDACACRKPQPGLILRAARDWNVDLEASFLVGDDDRDVEAARRAGVRGRKMSTDGDLAAALAGILAPRAAT
jgi:D-glycero-D-manno-heptose 1,7-bisphosphate phosphatase